MEELFGELSDDLLSSEDEPAEGLLDYATDSGHPAYLIGAVLAGLYQLPPPALLRHQNGLGRRVRYDSYRLAVPEWAPLAPGRFARAARGLAGSRCPHSGRRRRFGLYQMAIPEAAELNRRLFGLARTAQAADSDGVEVSNAAGGWHSQPDLFRGAAEGPIGTLRRWMEEAVRVAEADCGELAGCPARALATDAVEAWWNMSAVPGAWNRLHTHEGSCWSAVYYVAPGRFAGGGQLLLKPSPHLNDSTLPVLTDGERARLLPCEGALADPGPEIGEYMLLEPTEGTVVIFPSWLQHAVLPLEADGPVVPDQARLSVACNFNLQAGLESDVEPSSTTPDPD